MTLPRLHHLLHVAPFVLALALALSSCQTTNFYAQAVSGQLEIVAKAEPVESVIATTPDDTLRSQLQLTTRLLAFAEAHLDMPANGSFTRYSDLGRDHVVWVVHAAPELSLEPKRWWYPIVGCQAYRGFFSPEAASAETRRLHAKGYETWTSKVDAYSTLGYLRDPLLNTYIKRPEVDLAELIFHELAHQKYYVSGHTDFNEAMAEAVCREGVRKWLVHTGRPELVKRYDERLRRISQALDAIQQCAAELETVYQADAGPADKRIRKAAAIARLKSGLRTLSRNWGHEIGTWIGDTVNNPRINSFTTYEQDVPRFARLFDECDGDFTLFWQRVRQLKP